MERYPQMHIRFPQAKEPELYEKMKQLAHPPWSPQQHDPHGRPAESGRFYFHRDRVGDEPSCTICIWRKEQCYWIVSNIVPDEGECHKIPIEQFKKILTNFDSEIASPAVEFVKGIPPQIDTSQYRLEDYFSRQAVKLLQHFCETSNQGDLGTDLSDQEKWMAFLLQVYDDGNEVHCDIFRYCLQAAKWWPEKGIPILVKEYDFAMRLLKQSGR